MRIGKSLRTCQTLPVKYKGELRKQKLNFTQERQIRGRRKEGGYTIKIECINLNPWNIVSSHLRR
jgi:hypothetical protein